MTDKDYFAIFLIKIFVCSYDFFFSEDRVCREIEIVHTVKKKKNCNFNEKLNENLQNIPCLSSTGCTEILHIIPEILPT